MPVTDDKIRDFKLSPSRGVKSDADIIPPPAFSNTYVPHTYKCVVLVPHF